MKTCTYEKVLTSAKHKLRGPSPYAGIHDLREAVIGAAAEVDEAAEATKAPGLVAALYTVVGRIEAVPVPEIVFGELVELPVAQLGWWPRVLELHTYGLDVLALS